MTLRCALVGISLLGSLMLAAPVNAVPAGAQPLRLELATTATAPEHRGEWKTRVNDRNVLPRLDVHSARLLPVQPSLPTRALQSVLDAPDAEREAVDASSRPAIAQFRFERRGPAIKNVARSYRRMCDSVSRKLWDDPNGRRIKFDIAGKPGVGVEIPIR